MNQIAIRRYDSTLCKGRHEDAAKLLSYLIISLCTEEIRYDKI